MRFAFFLLLVIFAASCSAQNGVNKQTAETQEPKTENITKQAVLVELFTSEG